MKAIEFKRGRDRKKRKKRAKRFIRSSLNKVNKSLGSVKRKTLKTGLKGAGQALKGDAQRKTSRSYKGKAKGAFNSLVGRAKAAPTVLSSKGQSKVKELKKKVNKL